jgi:formate dehydrogenase maturation protein FdhE
MDDTDRMRNRATRLFALAQKAREERYLDYADELAHLAAETVRHAVVMEQRYRS